MNPYGIAIACAGIIIVALLVAAGFMKHPDMPVEISHEEPETEKEFTP